MKNLLPLFLFCLISVLSACSQNNTPDSSTGLWPPIEPYETGFLRVSDLHELYYERVGNPAGKPVIVLHGGPGGGCWPGMRQLFDPDKFMVVLFDQRGSFRSKPFAEIQDNDTWELVEDIEKLRRHLNIDKMMLEGGSWGSTLALAYSEKYPERVTDLVLRGIFTATDEEIDHFYHGGTAGIFPDAYQEFLQSLPNPEKRPLPEYLFSLLTGENKTLQKKISDAWLRYEWRISDVLADTGVINEWIRENDAYAFSLIENYYMANRCFLEEDQLWKNLNRIKHIPTTIVNGRFDMPCPLKTAFALHQNIPGSKLIIVEAAGHGGEPIMEAVANAVRNHEQR